MSATVPEPDKPVEQPEPVVTPEAPPPDPEAEFWSKPVDDPDLPPTLQGKTRKEIWDENKRAIQRAHQAGEQKNTAMTELEIQRRLNNVLQSQLQQRQPQNTPAYHQSLGITDPNAVATDAPTLLNAIGQGVDMRLGQTVQQLQQSMQQQLGAAVTDTLHVRAELAQANARETLKLDQGTFMAIRPYVAAIMAAKEMDPRNPQNWVDAVNDYKSQMAKLIPATQKNEITPAPAGNGKPNATVAKPRITINNKKMASALQPHLDAWNKGRPDNQKMKLEDFAEMLNSEAAMGVYE